MAEAKSIARNPDMPESMDFQELRREGIKYLQELSGQIWTDYNEHDPGVTLLEQVCYSLTDVAYRTNIAIEKLLFYSNDYKSVSNANALFDPQEILPNKAITLSDYRILILDQIRDINNVWFETVDENKLGISGLYNVVIQMSNDTPADTYDYIKDEVKRLFAANRNLCEDLNDIKILKPVPVSIHANIDINSNAVGEEVLSEIFYRIDNYLNPSVKFHTYEELKDKGISLDKIFEVPSFSHGFILPHELSHKNDEFYVTKIAEIISSIPGIRNVEDLTIKKRSIKVYGNTIKIEPGYFGQLDIDLSRDLEITKGGITYDYDASITRHLYEVKLDKHKSAHEGKFKWKFDKTVKPFSFNQISDFPSVQNTLPGVYGVGRFGLPDDASKERKAKAMQLKGFLLLFDQLMANHLAQLQKVNKLFSIEEDLDATYYGQQPVSFPDIDQLLEDPSNEGIQRIVHEFDDYLERKSRVFDHLLARFGEDFSDDLGGKIKNLFGDLSKREIDEEITRLKADFLKNYVHLSQARARAFNYFKNSIDEENVATFKKRICYLLNIKDHKQRSLTKHFSEMNLSIHDPGSKKVLGKKLGDSEGLQYRQTDSDSKKVTFLVRERKTLEFLFLKGGNRSNYHIKAAGDQYLILFYTDKKEFPVKISEAETIDDAQSLIKRLVAYFQGIASKSEGFHVVEHVLLRPYGVDEFHFQILDKDDTVLMESTTSRAQEDQKLSAEDALIAACDKSNYKRVQVKSGKHVIILRDRNNDELARVKGELPSEEATANKIDSLVKYFKGLEKDSTAFQKKVVFTAVKVEERTVGKDFYNARMSIVLPDWVARFQNEEFRLMLRNSIRQSIPGHLAVNFLYFDIEGMRNFESVQKKWLEQRANLDFDWKKLNVLSARLINILKETRNDK